MVDGSGIGDIAGGAEAAAGAEATGGGRNRWSWLSSWQGVDCTDCLPDLPDCDCLPDCGFALFSVGLFAVARPTRAARTRPTAPGRAGMLAIRGYQRWVSHRLPTVCRHTPSCSAYGMEAVRRYGLLAGSRLTAGRLRRCTHPTPYGTVDPVP